MTIFAKVNNGIVSKVIVADDTFFENFIDDSAGRYIETKEDGSIRNHYAGVGYTYNSEADVFIAPQPFPSWTLDTNTYEWNPPVELPTDTDNSYKWNEAEQQWVITTINQ